MGYCQRYNQLETLQYYTSYRPPPPPPPPAYIKKSPRPKSTWSFPPFNIQKKNHCHVKTATENMHCLDVGGLQGNVILTYFSVITNILYHQILRINTAQKVTMYGQSYNQYQTFGSRRECSLSFIPQKNGIGCQ